MATCGADCSRYPDEPMGGAALYLWLSLLCVLAVAALFGLGWGLSIFGRRRERLARERYRLARAERSRTEAEVVGLDAAPTEREQP